MRKLLIILFAAFAVEVIAQDNPKYLNVLASSGLNMRSAPDAKARVITKVPYGKQVEVLEKTKTEFRSGWITDQWYKVHFRGREGFLFGGYLSELKAPPKNLQVDMLPQLAVEYCSFSLKQLNASEITKEPTVAGDTLQHCLIKYANGVELESEIEGNRMETKLLAATSPAQLYVLLESLLMQAGKTSILNELRFIQGKDGQMKSVTHPEGLIRIDLLSKERCQLSLVAYQ